jgi:uncharacterized protein DUF4412
MIQKACRSTSNVARFFYLAAVLAVLCLTSPLVKAQSLFKPFSADQVHTMGNKTTKGKVYASEKAFRIESEEKGKKSISIMRFDRDVMWVLMPEQKMYMEMPFGGISDVAASLKGTKVQLAALGSEQVGPYHCDKARVQVTFEGKAYTAIEWAAKELNGFVVKTQDEKGTWSTEYQNVRLGSQDPSLFELPAGYQKLSMGNIGNLAKPN